MKLAACFCHFRRGADWPWETGLAIATEHSDDADVIAIYDQAGDRLEEESQYDFALDWTRSLDLAGLKERFPKPRGE